MMQDRTIDSIDSAVSSKSQLKTTLFRSTYMVAPRRTVQSQFISPSDSIYFIDASALQIFIVLYVTVTSRIPGCLWFSLTQRFFSFSFHLCLAQLAELFV